MIKSNRGYSLIEIGVGIIVITVFLLFSIGLFNGCYNNYRRIKARNLAMDRAIYHIEDMLQTDSDELAGFFLKQANGSRIPNPVFEEYVMDHFTAYIDKYAKFKGIEESNVELPAPGSDDLYDFIEEYSEFLINDYIGNEARREATQAQLLNGTYGFLDENGKVDEIKITLNNEKTFDPADVNDYVASNNGAIKIVKQVSRIPENNGKAFGNNVLLLKVTVYYTKEFKRNMTEADMEKIVIETVKSSI